MGANLSTPEKLAKLCRTGDSGSLLALLTDLQRNDAAFRTSRARYLEVADEQGNTPLTLAAARGHLRCVQLLVQFGANVHHVNRKPDGGSALHEAVAHKHEAVVELLLRHGANPFVENCTGFTAMDIACSTRNVPLLRRLEQCAPYVGWLLMKVPQFGGFGSSWQRRWVVVSHRYPNPGAPPSRQLTHCVFLAYKNLANTAPSCRVWLDGARAREVYNPKAEVRLQYRPGGGARVAQAGITLHRKHELPSGVYTTGGHPGGGLNPQEGYTFYLRPDDGSQVSINALDKLIRVVNNRGFPTDGPASGAGGAAPAAADAAAAAGAAFGGAAATQQQAQPQLPPAAAGPLFSALPPGAAVASVPTMANAPGTWSMYATSAGATEGTESDEQIARRLQEEYDAEVARQLQQGQEQEASAPAAAPATATQQHTHAAVAVVPPAAAAATTAPAVLAGAASGERPDYLTGGFYPQVHHADVETAGGAVGGRPGGGSVPETPGPGVENLHSFGRPTVPALLDFDYSPPVLPLAAGAAGAAALAGGAASGPSQHLPLSASGRHMSAPRLQDDAWLADVPAAPPSRPASESGAAATAPAVPAMPADDSDDSAICVFCMDAAATAGVLHGEFVHRCLCRECAVHLKESNVQHCPMCREPVEAYIMRVF